MSDREGNPLPGRAIAKARDNGNYYITANLSDYITTRFVGFKQKVVKVADVCSGGGCKYDIKLRGTELPELVITPDTPPILMAGSGKKPDWVKIGIISGVSLLAIMITATVLKKRKK